MMIKKLLRIPFLFILGYLAIVVTALYSILKWFKNGINQTIKLLINILNMNKPVLTLKTHKHMKRYPALFIKWLAHRFGYKITLLKSGKGTATIEGDKELLCYLDIFGYLLKKEPFDRFKNQNQKR